MTVYREETPLGEDVKMPGDHVAGEARATGFCAETFYDLG